MTTTDLNVLRPTALPVVAKVPGPTVLRLRNPWVLRTVVGCAVAAGAVLGALAGDWVFDADALDGVAGVALVAALAVAWLGWRCSRFEANPPESAFVPDNQADPV